LLYPLTLSFVVIDHYFTLFFRREFLPRTQFWHRHNRPQLPQSPNILSDAELGFVTGFLEDFDQGGTDFLDNLGGPDPEAAVSLASLSHETAAYRKSLRQVGPDSAAEIILSPLFDPSPPPDRDHPVSQFPPCELCIFLDYFNLTYQYL
jgi:hypothetical protein